MRGKDLYEKFTDIDNDIISDNYHVSRGRKQIYLKLLAATACLAVIISAISFLQGDKVVTDPNLPILTLDTEFSGGMGFEGYMAWGIEDLTNANPWNKDMNLTHLPVIQNKLTFNQIQRAEDPDFILMESLLKEVAQSLGMDIDKLPISDDAPDEATKKAITKKLTEDGGEVPEGYFDVGRLFMEDEKYKITVDTTYTVCVDYKMPIKLPDGYNFTRNVTYNEIYKVAEYLKAEYADFIDMENPMINIFGGAFNIYAQQSYSISFYEKSNDDTQNILNYHFNTVQFYGNDNGELYLARKYYTDLNQIVGVYPIIDTEEAQTLLENGNYITTVPEPFVDKKYIKKVELVYRTGTMEKLFMPYYKFYVELPDMKLENGLNQYGVYYVPAVEKQYIKNMPTWDGRFN